MLLITHIPAQVLGHRSLPVLVMVAIHGAVPNSPEYCPSLIFTAAREGLIARWI
jgi:hypothetical protein